MYIHIYIYVHIYIYICICIYRSNSICQAVACPRRKRHFPNICKYMDISENWLDMVTPCYTHQKSTLN